MSLLLRSKSEASLKLARLSYSINEFDPCDFYSFRKITQNV